MLPIVNEVIRAQQNINFKRQRMRCRDEFDINNIIELFRVNKNLFEELLRLLVPHIQVPSHSDKVPVTQKILVALRFYATGCYQRSVGEDFNLAVSQTSVHRYIHEVTNAIYEHLTARFIKFPTTRAEQNESKETYMDKFNFPGVLGAVDCTHIALLKPKVDEHNFFNRKGYHSLNTQMICDANLKILSINANYPGSTHDSFIWRQSQVRQYLMNQYHQNNLHGSWLIGDSGYPLEPCLMTPYLNPIPGSPEARYNSTHIRARNTVERTFGVLKSRFRCLLKERVARYEPRFVAVLVNVCAVLHNMCMVFGVELEENMAMDNDHLAHNHPPIDVRLFHEGQRIRNNLTRNYFNHI